MDIFAAEFRAFLALLNAHQVEHLLVGGYAVNLYGYSRPTGDLDVWVNPTAENIRRLATAIDAYGYDAADLREFAPQVATAGLKLELNEPPFIIDVMGQISGLQFTEVYPTHRVYELEGLDIHLINREALLLNKLASARLKDLDDIQSLHGVEAFLNGKKLEVFEKPVPQQKPPQPDSAANG